METIHDSGIGDPHLELLRFELKKSDSDLSVHLAFRCQVQTHHRDTSRAQVNDMRRLIRKAFGIHLPRTWLVDYPTAEEPGCARGVVVNYHV